MNIILSNNTQLDPSHPGFQHPVPDKDLVKFNQPNFEYPRGNRGMRDNRQYRGGYQQYENLGYRQRYDANYRDDF